MNKHNEELVYLLEISGCLARGQKDRTLAIVSRMNGALSTAAPESGTAIEWPDPGELESWRAMADDLLREMHSPRSFTIRRAAHLLQNAYLFASKAAPTAGETL